MFFIHNTLDLVEEECTFINNTLISLNKNMVGLKQQETALNNTLIGLNKKQGWFKTTRDCNTIKVVEHFPLVFNDWLDSA